MLLEAKIEENGKLTVEYDEEGHDGLIRAGIFSGLWKAMDDNRIGELEQEIKRLKKVNRKLRKKLRDEN